MGVNQSKVVDRDPRSPTPDISRTPLESVDVIKNSPITKNIDLTKECFEKYCDKMPLNPAVRAIMNELDPRSPTVDFQRTPLAVLIRDPELMAVYNSANVSTISCGEINFPITDEELRACTKNLEKELHDMSAEDAEKRMEQLTVDVREDENCAVVDEQKAPVLGLLETNLDYLETDLDTVRRRPKKFPTASQTSDVQSVEPKQEIIETETVEPVVPAKTADLSDKVENTMSDDSAKEKELHDSIESKVEIMEIFNYNNSLQKRIPESTKKPHNGDSLLIYEDTIPSDEPVIQKKSASNGGTLDSSRTPLASMMNIEPTSKVVLSAGDSNSKKVKSKIPIKIKQSDTPRFVAVRNCHSPKAVQSRKASKIAAGEIENTPPKIWHARWDQDNSVIL